MKNIKYNKQNFLITMGITGSLMACGAEQGPKRFDETGIPSVARSLTNEDKKPSFKEDNFNPLGDPNTGSSEDSDSSEINIAQGVCVRHQPSKDAQEVYVTENGAYFIKTADGSDGSELSICFQDKPCQLVEMFTEIEETEDLPEGFVQLIPACVEEDKKDSSAEEENAAQDNILPSPINPRGGTMEDEAAQEICEEHAEAGDDNKEEEDNIYKKDDTEQRALPGQSDNIETNKEVRTWWSFFFGSRKTVQK